MAKELKLSIEFCQSNSESELINSGQRSRGAFRRDHHQCRWLHHTSVALMDALMLTELPVYEVHLGDIFRRESFRHHSYISYAATGVICGLGAAGYTLALRAVAQNLQTKA